MTPYLSNRIALILVTGLLSFTPLVATDTIPVPIDTTGHCIQEYYDRITASELEQHKEDNKKEWMKYIPSAGLTYTPSGEPRPAISIGSSMIYSSYKDKQRRLNIIRGIQLRNQISADTEILNYNKLLQQLELMILDLAAKAEVFEIDQELFDFYTKQYESQELKPSDYLLKKKAYFTQREGIRQAEMGIEMWRLEVREAGRCG